MAKGPDATQLHRAVAELLYRVDVRPWDSTVAQHYGLLQADLEQLGKPLAALDLQIAVHARSSGAVLVTNDQAFRHIADLQVQVWTKPDQS